MTRVSAIAAITPSAMPPMLKSQSLADDQREDAAAAGAERHPHADLGRALTHGRGQHAVETDHREDRGDRGEDADQDQREARRRDCSSR